jgi:hypothetical protein
MAQPRRDGYGRPLPELADAQKEVLLERPFNQQQRRLILRLLEEQYRLLLRRGTHAAVVLQFDVQDGMIQTDIKVTIGRLWRQPPEGQ